MDRGMATKSTSLSRGWLLLVGCSSPNVSALWKKYRCSEAYEDDRHHDREPAPVDSAGQRHAEELERREVLDPGRPFENRPDLLDQEADKGQTAKQADRRTRVPRCEHRTGPRKNEGKRHQQQRRFGDLLRAD